MRQSDLFIQPKRPWNAGRMIGPKAPLKPEHIWIIRQPLKVAKRVRDLAMFNCALDAKRGPVTWSGSGSATWRPAARFVIVRVVVQQKTGRTVPFENTEPARDAIAAWLKVRGERDDDWLLPSRGRPGQHLGTRQYAPARRPVGSDDPDLELQGYGTHSLRRTKASLTYWRRTISAPFSCCSVTGSWRAPSGASASR